MMSNDILKDSQRISHYSGNNQNTTMANQSSYMYPTNEGKSDLVRDWMEPENLVSHSAINQISYLLLIKRKEVKVHQALQTTELNHKKREMIQFRKEILENFEDSSTIERRIHRYILMGDEIGLQSALYLLLILSDDHKKLLNINDVLNQTFDT